MSNSTTRRARPAEVAASVLAVAVAVAGVAASGAAGASSSKLVGTFKITKGVSVKGSIRGSYFRMVYPGGNPKSGPFFANPNSSSSNKTYTLVSPGTQGGLRTGAYQPAPKVAFDSKGDSLAGLIIKPTSFTGINFGVLASAKDAQTGKALSVPTITVSSGHLSGDVRAFNAAWNKLYFNHGSPKANGSRPGLTSRVTGAYNAKTHAYTLTWSGAIVGGPFNGFTGVWHLTGVFKAGK